ncbi:hypothetical protein [Tatumella sp. OPLPL6]|uniref:hypothetical protein n=1 Tax=Tatumella sp. OPLPL6 TaxID=1928657 RepID=UPI000C17EE54|nr:hypothetical protein [Tatumella sp. OPLPL6]PIJ41961.1 hypothetical protein BOM24_13635 [Tatumella sp. OPLPL6]
MKSWLVALALLTLSGTAAAQSIKIVHSKDKQLDVWLDNVAGKEWCGPALTMRIVTQGSKKVAVINDYIPRVGALLAHQCSRLQKVEWRFVDDNAALLAEGYAEKKSHWAVKLASSAPLPEPAPAVQPAEPKVSTTTPAVEAAPSLLINPESRLVTDAPLADTQPWQSLTLTTGCRVRQFSQSVAQDEAWFIPESTACDPQGWLTGPTSITLSSQGRSQQMKVTFLQGFAITGLAPTAELKNLHLVAVNKQRMILRTKTAPQSWLILPYQAEQHAWNAKGQLVLQLYPYQLNDIKTINRLSSQTRQAWGKWVSDTDRLPLRLVDRLYPQLANPAVSVYQFRK